MKNGITIKGHRRLVTKTPTGGHLAGCICGWSLGDFQWDRDARRAYRAHLEEVLETPFICKTCGQAKPLSEMRGDYRYQCVACFSAKGKRWQRQNPEAANRLKRNHHFITNYGITFGEAEAILAAQGFRCAICRDTLPKAKRARHVDHDHETGRVRGILCFRCNVGLGSFRDRPDLLADAIRYLQTK